METVDILLYTGLINRRKWSKLIPVHKFCLHVHNEKSNNEFYR